VVNAYSSDPLVHNRISARLYGQTFAQAQELISKAGEIKLPYLLLHGGDDQLIDPAGSRSFFAASRAPDRALKVYPGLFHEVFNEVAREQVYSDVLSWLEARQAKLPSAAG
jgi:alpha-beta hydrolase superfamily lysophospholipase